MIGRPALAFGRAARLAGVATTIVAHLAMGAWVTFGDTSAPPRAPLPDRPEEPMCTRLAVGAACGVGQCGRIGPDGRAILVDDRRCPAPMHRRPRRDIERPPVAEVDLLQAALVPAIGVPLDQAKMPRMVPGAGGTSRETGAPTRAPGPIPKNALPSVLGKQGRLGAILGGPGPSQRSKKLGQIVGTADGSPTGYGSMARNGSEYVALVQIELQSKFVLPPNVPEWELPHRWARVRITRMAADGTVLAWAVMRPSGLPAFDMAVDGLLRRYKGGRERFPVPPSEVLEAINARGMVVDLLGRLK